MHYEVMNVCRGTSVVDINNLPEHVTYYERSVTRPNGQKTVECSIRVFLGIIRDGQKKRISRTISVNQNGLDTAVDMATKWIAKQKETCTVLSRPEPPVKSAPTFDWDRINSRYINRGSSITVRVPGADHAIFHNSKAAEAIALRDQLCAALGIDLNAPPKRKARRPFAKRVVNAVKSDKTLAPGVFYSEFKVLGANGVASIRRTYRTSVMVKVPGSEERKEIAFTRSANRYGHKEALRMVEEWRAKKVAEHYVKHEP